MSRIVLSRAACAYLRSSRRKLKAPSNSKKNLSRKDAKAQRKRKAPDSSFRLSLRLCDLCVRNPTSSAVLALCDSNDSVNGGDVKRFDAPVGPFDFEFIDLCRCTQTEVQRHIVLRTKHRSAQNILSLPHRACRQVSRCTERIARAFLRDVADQSQAQPVSIRRRDIAQQHRPGIKIIDHEIKSTIAVEIADRQATTGPRIR